MRSREAGLSFIGARTFYNRLPEQRVVRGFQISRETMPRLAGRVGKKFQEARTDSFGDFKFDNLDPDSGLYTISVGSKEKAVVMEINLGQSYAMGEILI